MRIHGLSPSTLLRLVAVLALASALTLISSHACASANPATSSPSALAGVEGATPTSCTENDNYEPTGPVPTFTEKPFWIVLGLIVLGWLVLAADYPDDQRQAGGHHEKGSRLP